MADAMIWQLAHRRGAVLYTQNSDLKADVAFVSA